MIAFSPWRWTSSFFVCDSDRYSYSVVIVVSTFWIYSLKSPMSTHWLYCSPVLILSKYFLRSPICFLNEFSNLRKFSNLRLFSLSYLEYIFLTKDRLSLHSSHMSLKSPFPHTQNEKFLHIFGTHKLCIQHRGSQEQVFAFSDVDESVLSSFRVIDSTQ